MTHPHEHPEHGLSFNFPNRSYLKRLAVVSGILLTVIVVLFLMLWNAFFVYVPPGKHLVIMAKDGAPLEADQVLAEPGQKGIQREVMGEGWHFVLPIVYTTELEDNTIIPPGKVGLITARGGKELTGGRILAEEGERGIQRQVLNPGSYRLNKHGFTIDPVDAVEIKPGYVGVRRRLQGKAGQNRFAQNDDERGYLSKVLQPGLYYINPHEYEVIRAEVGIFQTPFHYDVSSKNNTAIEFTSKGGFKISMDCTIEWEVLPEDMPKLVAEYGDRRAVEKTVIDLQAHAIGRDKGIDYGAQDLLEGSKRETFQTEFTKELERVCKEKNVTVHSAFIRNIVIPEEYLKPIRDKQIASETELTNSAKQVTAKTQAEVETATQMIEKKVAEVQAETKRLVAALDREAENIETSNKAEIEKLMAEFEAKIAALDAERIEVKGKAEAEVKKLKETAKNGLYQLKMELFQNDGQAFLRYSLAEELNPKMVLRLFHSGAGTLWTNMDSKGINLLLPAPGSAPTKAAAIIPGK